jgi:hypothetical protein
LGHTGLISMYNSLSLNNPNMKPPISSSILLTTDHANRHYQAPPSKTVGKGTLVNKISELFASCAHCHNRQDYCRLKQTLYGALRLNPFHFAQLFRC